MVALSLSRLSYPISNRHWSRQSYLRYFLSRPIRTVNDPSSRVGFAFRCSFSVLRVSCSMCRVSRFVLRVSSFVPRLAFACFAFRVSYFALRVPRFLLRVPCFVFRVSGFVFRASLRVPRFVSTQGRPR